MSRERGKFDSELGIYLPSVKRHERRHERERSIEHAVRVVREQWYPEPDPFTGESKDAYLDRTYRIALKYHDNLKMCSCEACSPNKRVRKGKNKAQIAAAKRLRKKRADRKKRLVRSAKQ